MINWQSVPQRCQAEWQQIYQSSQESLNLSEPCPVCSAVSLHRWYQKGKNIKQVIEDREFAAHGGLWEWCSNCHSFEHYSCLVPSWWSCNLKVDVKKLTLLPTAIEEARINSDSQNIN
jgi:hypothetical protein